MVFRDRLTKKEFIGAMLILVLHCVFLPRLVGYAALLFGWGLNGAQLNLLYYFISFLLVLCLLGKYLRRSFDNLIEAPAQCFYQLCVAWAVCLVLNFLINLLLAVLLVNMGLTVANPNQTSVDSLASNDMRSMMVLAVLLAPMVEEPIFRGGVFCTLRHKNRLLAYVVTVLIFGLYHVWSYAVSAHDPRLLVYILQYIPGGVALCRCYDKSGSIWTAIVFHMSYNLLTML